MIRPSFNICYLELIEFSNRQEDITPSYVIKPKLLLRMIVYLFVGLVGWLCHVPITITKANAILCTGGSCYSEKKSQTEYSSWERTQQNAQRGREENALE